jgi:hypothetical protein
LRTSTTDLFPIGVARLEGLFRFLVFGGFLRRSNKNTCFLSDFFCFLGWLQQPLKTPSRNHFFCLNTPHDASRWFQGGSEWFYMIFMWFWMALKNIKKKTNEN